MLGSLVRAVDGLGRSKDEVVLVAGIGCSGRLAAYVDFNTVHATHGRALALATGIKMANPELTVIAIMERLIERLYKNLSVRVLVADDSRLFRSRITSLLHNLNLQSVEAEDGQQALDIFTADPNFSLIITDYNMPRLDGFDLIEAIRAHHPKDTLSIIGISAENGGHIARFLKIGANDFLVKPIQVEEFTCRVHQQLDMAASTP